MSVVRIRVRLVPLFKLSIIVMDDGHVVNLLGPPYRWLLPDCECFYTENLYVKTAAEQKIDAYFTLASLTTCDDEFWKANGDKPLDTFTSAAKADILTQVRNESKRRLELPGVYRDNANDIARKRSQNQWAPIDPSLYEPFSPVINGDEPPDLAPGLPASEVFTPEWLQAWKCVKQGGDPRLLHVHNECFEIPLFTDVFVSKLVAEITHFKVCATVGIGGGLGLLLGLVTGVMFGLGLESVSGLGLGSD